MSQQIRYINGFEVHIVYRRMKNIRMRVVTSDGQLQIHAPFGTSQAQIESFISKCIPWIHKQCAQLADSPRAHAERASKEEQQTWREVVEAAAPVLVERWEKILGVQAQKLVYRNMKSRWGSCQPETGRICINTRLALYPPECLEYVIVHELCHLRHPNHGKGFYALLEAALPEWRTWRDKLKR